MGLDMYLSKKRYVKNWDHDTNNKWQITVKHNGKIVNGKMPIKEVVYEAGYWRKANAIHQWFVDNVQGGKDDCNEYWVSKDQLKELLEKCREVVAVAVIEKGKVANGQSLKDGKWEDNLEDGETITNPEAVAKILPTASGFFFGSTNYDQWYMEDIKSTIKILETCLEDSDGDFYYQSSW